MAEAVSPALCRAELERALASRTFSKSVRLRALLEYIGTCSIEKRFDELSEQQIGISVFQRPPGYNSTEDTIVRVTARHLRERLDLYYREEGQGNPLKMAVPKGSYVVTFQVSAPPESSVSLLPMASALPDLDTTRIEAPVPTVWPRTAWFAVIGLALLSIALPLAVYQHLRSQPQPQAQSGLQPFGPPILWQALFTPGRKTLIVPGDASLDAYTAWEQRSVSLADYTNQTYQGNVTVSSPPNHKDVPLSVRSVTPMADLRMISDLVRVPEWMGQPAWGSWIEICYSRDMVVANTHDNNLVLIGSETFNPWVKLYQGTLDFYVHWDYAHDVYYVTNRAPKPGEKQQYIYNRRVSGMKAYTLLALTDNVQGEGRVLLIEGTTMGTTYGAVNFFTNEQLWQPVIRAATDRNGKLHNFEALLSSEFVRGGASNTQIVSLHVHQ